MHLWSQASGARGRDRWEFKEGIYRWEFKARIGGRKRKKKEEGSEKNEGNERHEKPDLGGFRGEQTMKSRTTGTPICLEKFIIKTNTNTQQLIKHDNKYYSKALIMKTPLVKKKNSSTYINRSSQGALQQPLLMTKVVRAKASRCTKVFFGFEPQSIVNVNSAAPSSAHIDGTSMSFNGGRTNDHVVRDNLSSFMASVEKCEFGISEFLNTNFQQLMCEIVGNDVNGVDKHKFSSNSDHIDQVPLMSLHEDMVEDWNTNTTDQDCCTQLDGCWDLEVLASFLDSDTNIF
ncbi:hypothetical protein Syun_026527 [Stephania yunnanensis]|uniref:Uncharacterized protein n=1 Tax=Stephania yunnanensis TaxID=152371 RepID=A0AAP0EZ31_9MAGN